jgi:hypothetical protein
MAGTFDLRKVLKQISAPLRTEFLGTFRELRKARLGGLKQLDVDPIIAALQTMKPAKRRAFQVLLQRMTNLESNNGIKVLLEELQQCSPEKVTEWAKLDRRIDKVMWTYLNARDAFEEATIFARADALSGKRCWNRWSGTTADGFAVTDDRIESLKTALRTHYSRNELRGEHCEIHHYTRLGGAEYFFAYLPDWPDNFQVFNDNGELQTLDVPTAFTNLFVYTPQTGTLEMIAAGGKPAQLTLRRIFYQALLESEVEDADPDKPAYLLDHLLEPGFQFSWSPADQIAEVSIDSHDIEGLASRFRPGISWAKVQDNLDAILASRDLSRSQVSIDHIRIRIKLLGDGRRRGRVLTINITPRSCDLKDQDDDELRTLGERCLRQWRIDNA